MPTAADDIASFRVRARGAAVVRRLSASALLAFAAAGIAGQDGDGEVQDRFGRQVRWFTADGKNRIVVDDEVVAEAELSGVVLESRHALGDEDVLLFAFRGGTACLHNYRLLHTSARTVAMTDYFGSCGDSAVRQTDDHLVIDTSGACHGLDDSEAQRTCDASMASRYVYRDGTITTVFDRREVAE